MTPQKSKELTKKYMKKVLLENKTVHPDYVDQQVESDYVAMEKAVDITKYYGNLPEFNKRLRDANEWSIPGIGDEIKQFAKNTAERIANKKANGY